MPRMCVTVYNGMVDDVCDCVQWHGWWCVWQYTMPWLAGKQNVYAMHVEKCDCLHAARFCFVLFRSSLFYNSKLLYVPWFNQLVLHVDWLIDLNKLTLSGRAITMQIKMVKDWLTFIGLDLIEGRCSPLDIRAGKRNIHPAYTCKLHAVGLSCPAVGPRSINQSYGPINAAHWRQFGCTPRPVKGHYGSWSVQSVSIACSSISDRLTSSKPAAADATTRLICKRAAVCREVDSAYKAQFQNLHRRKLGAQLYLTSARDLFAVAPSHAGTLVRFSCIIRSCSICNRSFCAQILSNHWSRARITSHV
jgi:hypothetical protein